MLLARVIWLFAAEIAAEKIEESPSFPAISSWKLSLATIYTTGVLLHQPQHQSPLLQWKLKPKEVEPVRKRSRVINDDAEFIGSE